MKKISIEGCSVTPLEVNKAISKIQYCKMGEKITICHLTLVDGHELIGYSGVVNPENFDMEIGSKIAFENAKNQVWSHMGSILQDRMINGETK